MKRFSKRLLNRVGRYFGAGTSNRTAERPLVTESLEQRVLLTTVVEMRLDVTDVAGTPLTSIDQDGTFELRGYVQDVRENPEVPPGMFAAFLDVSYDDSAVSPVGTKFLNWPYLSEIGETFEFDLDAGIVRKAGAALSSVIDYPIDEAGELLMFRIPFTADGGTPITAVDDDQGTDLDLRIGAGTGPHTFDVMANDVLGGLAIFTGSESTNAASLTTLFQLPLDNGPVPTEDINYGEASLTITSDATYVISQAGPSVDPGASNLSDKGGALQVIGGGQRISYAPPASMNSLPSGQTDTDTFSYEISNGVGGTDTAIVTVTIVGSAPTQIDISLNPGKTSVDPVTGETVVVPDSRTWLDAWENYWVEIWAQTPISDNAGIGSASVDLSYDTTYHTATQIEYGPGFTADGQATIDDANGQVLNIAGTTSSSDIGDDGVALLARVKFERTAADAEVTHNADGQYLSPEASLTTQLTRFEAELDPPGGGEASGTQGPVTVDLWPVMYDLNNDDSLGFPDFSFFAAVFLQSVDDNDAAYASDFDRSGTVDFGDISFFAANFGQTADSTVARQYPPGFPDDWTTTLSLAAAALPSGTAPRLTDDQLASVVDAAVNRLESNSAADVAVASLGAVTVEIVDLPGNLLGLADEDQQLVQIDIDAAGYGWFVDTTPWDDAEFTGVTSGGQLSASPESGAASRVDLLTVVMHELGHLLGYADDDGHPLMESTLSNGTRRLAEFNSEGETDTLDQAFAGLADGV